MGRLKSYLFTKLIKGTSMEQTNTEIISLLLSKISNFWTYEYKLQRKRFYGKGPCKCH